MSDETVPAPTEAPASVASPGAFDLLLASGPDASLRGTAQDAVPGPPGVPVRPLGPPGAASLRLERHEYAKVRTTGVLDWVSLALSVVAPPVGVLAAVAAIIVGVRRNGFAAAVAKVAVIVGVILTIVLLVALYLMGNTQKKVAAHDAIVASSVQFCTQLKASGFLPSPTYGFPASQDTIPDSIAAIQKYDDFWTGLVKVAPSGIRTGTELVAKTAGTLLTSATVSRVVDDGSNASQMQQAVNNSGINAWVSSYCK